MQKKKKDSQLSFSVIPDGEQGTVLSTLLDLSTLEAHLWEAANILRDPVDAADFKTYIFPLLFFKRISDVYDEEIASALAESGGIANGYTKYVAARGDTRHLTALYHLCHRQTASQNQDHLPLPAIPGHEQDRRACCRRPHQKGVDLALSRFR